MRAFDAYACGAATCTPQTIYTTYSNNMRVAPSCALRTTILVGSGLAHKHLQQILFVPVFKSPEQTTMDYKLENRTCPVFQSVPFSAVDLANFLKSTLFLYFWKPCSCAHHYSTAVAVLGGLLVCLLVGYQARDTTCTVGSYYHRSIYT